MQKIIKKMKKNDVINDLKLFKEHSHKNILKIQQNWAMHEDIVKKLLMPAIYYMFDGWLLQARLSLTPDSLRC